jgi:hypothetical protein
MGEAKQNWIKLFDGSAHVAISRPKARPVSTQKYIAKLPAGFTPAVSHPGSIACEAGRIFK